MNARSCTRCGTTVADPTAAFCRQCGCRLTDSITVGAPAPARRRRAVPVALATTGALVAGGLIVVLAILLLASPGDRPPAAGRALTGSLDLGQSETLATGTSRPGTPARLTAPADGPLGGIEVSVPADAYPDAVGFTLTATPITGQSYGPLINPVSPLIGVENGERLAAAPITVRIPVDIPDGHFALAFYAGPDGGLEAIPLVAEDASSITIATRHFSSFFVSTIASALLPDDIGTGFRPGEDDFSTPNYGSVVKPGGHCAGQSLAEMWYFTERKQAHGEPNLWDRYDASRGGPKTAGFWQDDAAAYRLSSEVQRDLNWDTLTARIELAFEENRLDRLTYDAFRYAMLVTGAPQFVGLSVGGQGGGHVIVAYAVTRSGLWVADPNDPGKLRQVAWVADRGAFNPYQSGSTAGSGEAAYDQIGFYGRTALVDWARIGALVDEADAGTIGRGTGEGFPSYDILTTVPGADGSAATVASIVGHFASPGAELAISPSAVGSTLLLRVTAYRGTEPLDSADSNQTAHLELDAGTNEIGFYMEAATPDGWVPVDFVRSTITVPSAATPSAEPTGAAETLGTDQTTDTPGRVTVIDPANWTFDCSQPPPWHEDSETIEMQYALAWVKHCGGTP